MSCERCDQIHAGPCAEDVVDDQEAEAEAAGAYMAEGGEGLGWRRAA